MSYSYTTRSTAPTQRSREPRAIVRQGQVKGVGYSGIVSGTVTTVEVCTREID